MGTSNIASRLSDFERHAREAAAEFNAKEFAKLGEPCTGFDLQGDAAYLALSAQTLSRYGNERTAPPSVKVGNGRRFHRNDSAAWIRGDGIFAFESTEKSSSGWMTCGVAELDPVAEFGVAPILRLSRY
jgi:hypothetical protein